uniref:NADH-ubiquinone oxidoreductase chain 6 n=1 Tax=Staphylinidae sp. BMNH 1274206 TaxID=1796557 RepID=A0A140EGS1_9COLE|nr:NADH dehydrogenase subunit 6 [Staphylinidae sp. BMNH 1274206]
MIMLLMNCILSAIFTVMNHPMTLGIILLMQTILVSLITGHYSMNFWFSYILILIMVGGMLVLFIYMTSIASNEPFNFSMKISFLLMLIFLIIITMNLFLDNFILYQFFNMKEMSNNNFLTKYFNYPHMILILVMINYLFITLIASVKIIKIEFGPLRQKF